MYEIPVTNDPVQTLRTNILGQTYHLKLRWQPIDEAWYMSIRNDRLEPIRLNLRIEDNQRIVGTYIEDLPGDFIIICNENRHLAEANLGSDCRLYFLDNEELAEIY